MSYDEADKPVTRQAIEAVNRSGRNKVTGKLRIALTQMVWAGSRRADAAREAGMSNHGLREALKKPHVKAYYLAELGTLRESERAKTFHRLCDLRDQDENKNAAVAAAKALEQIADEAVVRNAGVTATPGVVIKMVTLVQAQSPAQPPTLTIENEPTVELRIEPPQPAPRLVDERGQPIFTMPPR
jgi:hypothetical protein